MKYHAGLKCLALLLCALALLSTLAGGFCLIALGSQGLHYNTPETVEEQERDTTLNVLASQLVFRYASVNLGGCPEELAESYRHGWYSYMRLGEWYYTLSDEDGKLLFSNLEDKTLPLSDSRSFCSDYLVLLPEEDAVTTPQRTEEAFSGEPEPTTDSRERFYYYNAQGNPLEAYVRLAQLEAPLTVSFYFADGGPSMPEEWGYFVQLYQWRTAVIIALAVGLTVFLGSLIYLCFAAGRKPGREELLPGGLNRIPLDLYALAVFLAALFALSLLERLGGNMLLAILRGEAGTLLALVIFLALALSLMATGFLFAFAAQAKTPGYLWRHSVVGACLLWVWRILERIFRQLRSLAPPAASFLWRLAKGLLRSCRDALGWCVTQLKRAASAIGRTVSRLFALLPLTWQWILMGLTLATAVFIALVADSDLIQFFSAALCVVLIFYVSQSFGVLLEGVKAMSKGDLDAKIPEKHLVGCFRQFAGYLTDLAGVAVVAAEKQTKSERMKTELITNVSHDIKTPLTSIINYVDLLQKAQTQEEREEYLEVLERQSQRMKKLIEDLMEMSKATTGNIPVDIRQVDAAETVNQALGEFSAKLEAAQLTPVYDPGEAPIPMNADGRLAWRVLSNLLSNAVKYAMPGTRLYIDIRQLEGRVLISLKNVSREPLNITAEELMERFVRGDASRNTEGSGLGLNISKNLMELQGGELRLLVDGDLFKATVIFPQG